MIDIKDFRENPFKALLERRHQTLGFKCKLRVFMKRIVESFLFFNYICLCSMFFFIEI